MNNQELECAIEWKVKAERRITRELLELIALADNRKLYAERGHSSLFDWLVKRFGYSNSAAYRRVCAARMILAVPTAGEKIETGKLNLSGLSKAHQIIKAHEKASRSKVSQMAKAQAVGLIESKSTVEAEQSLYEMFPEAAHAPKPEMITVLDANTYQISTTASNEVMERFRQVRDAISNQLPDASLVQVFDYLLQDFLAAVSKRTSAAAAMRVNDVNKTVTPRTKRIILSTSKHRCTYRDRVTGKRCLSRYQVQVDHRRMQSHGGKHQAWNLRPMCAVHNRLLAEKFLGKERANRWRGS